MKTMIFTSKFYRTKITFFNFFYSGTTRLVAAGKYRMGEGGSGEPDMENVIFFTPSKF